MAIKNPNLNKIIFLRTNLKNLKKALEKDQFIDLAIFDEAHRTATVNRNIESNLILPFL